MGREHRPVLRSWRVAGITALGDWVSPSRITATAVRLAVQLFLVVCLWRALYAGTVVSAGLTMQQAVSYAVLAVLAMCTRATSSSSSRDTVIQHIQYGTIVYWFLRPLSPRRYYLLRAAGDQVYGLVWAITGYTVCLVAGILSPPVSVTAAAAFAATFAVGQSVLYYLVLLTNQLCFWTIKNSSAVSMLAFAQNLLSGSYAALWYFPHWFQSISAVLPFQATLAVPASFYVGRLAVHDLPGQLAVQLAWLALLAACARLVWRKAAERVVSQGG
jgi:ABC-2 type transport system permease protein